MPALLLFLKYPEPGKVKTRLARDIGDGVAAELYRESVRMVLEKVRDVSKTSPALSPIVEVTPAEQADAMAEAFSIPWPIVPQVGADLGERMRNAAERAFEAGHDSVLFLGGDSPTLPAGFLRQAVEAAARELAVGPAADGGYWTLGMPWFLPEIFRDIDWGTDRVLSQTLQRAREAGLPVRLLPAWYDIDTLDDLRRAMMDDGGKRLGRILEVGSHPDGSAE